VGEKGLVVGVDLAEALLKLARTKAEARGLSNVDFQRGDTLALSFNDSSFDAVVCVFGIFFVPDMAAAVRELWRVVKPGGKLAITTWGPRFFEPASTAFWNSIREVRPDLYKGFNPWDRICDPQSLDALLKDAGVDNVDTVAESGVHHIPTPEAWWSAVMGSGYRGTIDQLDADAREHVRTANYNYIRKSGPLDVEANVIYAIAKKIIR
jgi:ubiquinone/menaquinone biosynthesis C-methylase UbiE